MRRKGVPGLILLAGALLLWSPARHPMFTKFALGMTLESDSASGGDSMVAQGTPFSTWEAVLSTVDGFFPEPSGDTSVRPFLNVEGLLDAVRSGQGECSTWTEAFMVICSGNGFVCREWAVVPDPGTPASGHAVVDIWIPEWRHWAMIEVFLGFWVRGEKGRPLSASEFESRLLAGRDPGEIVALSGRTPAVRLADTYYGDPRSRLVEIVNNEPTMLMEHWTRRVERANKPVGQFLQQVLGVGPRYRITSDRPGRVLRTRLTIYRWRTVLGLICILVAVVAVTWGWMSRRRAATTSG